MAHARLVICAMTAVLTLAACHPAAPPSGPDECGAAALQHLRGQPVQDAPALPGMAVRIIGPDTAVTMDFRPDRLNIEHDHDRIITRVFCG